MAINCLVLLVSYGGIIWAILKNIIGEFLSTAQKHNAQFLKYNSLMPNNEANYAWHCLY